MKVDVDSAQKLLALAMDDAASHEERRTCAMIICTWLAEEQVLPQYKKHKAKPGILGYVAERIEFDAIAAELRMLYQFSQASGYHRPRHKDVQETLRKRLYVRGQRPMTREEIETELGRPYVPMPEDSYV
jgi:hypothetical protein